MPARHLTNRMPQEDLTSPRLTPSPRGGFAKVCLAMLTMMMVLAGVSFWTYGHDSYHHGHSSIWWSPRVRSLTPPTATAITLQRDFLDHYATYTIAEKDLNAFLNDRFADEGEVLDSFRERSRVNPRKIGEAIGPLGWVVTKGTVVYSYSMSNGASSQYYHDPTTGRTFQSSAHW